MTSPRSRSTITWSGPIDEEESTWTGKAMAAQPAPTTPDQNRVPQAAGGAPSTAMMGPITGMEKPSRLPRAQTPPPMQASAPAEATQASEVLASA